MTSVSVGSSGFGRMPFVMQQKYLAVSFQGSLSSLQWEVYTKVGFRLIFVGFQANWVMKNQVHLSPETYYL